jgi:anti-sigma B factor antagonist
MKMQIHGDKLCISDIKELGTANADALREQARAALTQSQKHIDVDLSQTLYVDSRGLGALVSLHKTACSRDGVLRVLRPAPAVQQILELTRMHRLFEIVAA